MKNPTAPCLLALFLILGSAGNGHGQDNASDPGCSEEERKIAREMDRDPDALYRMGRKIKKFVRNKDLKGLLSLTDDYLIQGPRKNIANSHEFDDVFSAAWRDSVLEDKIPCYPVNFHSQVGLGNGMLGRQVDLYYRRRGVGSAIVYSEGGILAIHGARNKDAQWPSMPAGWKIREGIVPPRCLGFSEYHEREYDSLDQCLNEYAGAARQPEIEWPVALESESMQEVMAAEKWVVSRLPDDNGLPCCRLLPEYNSDPDSNLDCSVFCPPLGYRVLRGMPLESCRKLAPEAHENCVEAFLVAVAEWQGGSAFRHTGGWGLYFAAFGLFSGRDGKRKIASLESFSTENDAMDFLDSVRK